MKKENSIFVLFALICIFALFIYLSISLHNIRFLTVSLLSGVIIITGIFYIPNKPPHIGVITVWGKRTNNCLDEGFNFLPLRGIVYNFILVNVLKKNIDFGEQTLITPKDNVTTKVESAISYTPDKDNIINYLNIGEEAGIQHMIEDIQEEKLRNWSRSTTEGPQKWEELISAKDEAIKIIISEICGTELPDEDVKKIHQGHGKWQIESLGIVLNRYNLTKMEPFGEVYESSIELQKEKKQRKSEEYEVNTNMQKAKLLKRAIEKSLKESGEKISLSECFNNIMKWQMLKEGKGFIYEGSLGNFSGIGNLISSILKGDKK